jgi:peptide deformylase
MQAARGVGLAAQQVGQTLQVMVLDVREVRDRPSTLEWDGNPMDPNAFMPLALINPEVKPAGPLTTGPEGCLSFPEMYADVARPEAIDVRALDQAGTPLTLRCGGLLSRAIQHELDHLKGILLVDRMDIETKDKLRPELDLLQAQTKAGLAAKANTKPPRK